MKSIGLEKEEVFSTKEEERQAERLKNYKQQKQKFKQNLRLK
jgi:hypothetical protein